MAERLEADYIITRDDTGFTGSFIRSLDRNAFFETLEQQGIIYEGLSL